MMHKCNDVIIWNYDPKCDAILSEKVYRHISLKIYLSSKKAYLIYFDGLLRNLQGFCCLSASLSYLWFLKGLFLNASFHVKS